METLKFEAQPVPSDDIAVESRIISGLALPYGVPGNTSGGKVSVEPGAIKIPHDLKRVKLLRDHDRSAPVGYVESIEDTPEGLQIKFKVGTTADGTTALTEASEGIRDGLSVELSAVKRSPDGSKIVEAVLDAVALVSVPAFSDARVSSVIAQDTPDAVAPATQKEEAMSDNIIEAAADKTDVVEAPAPLRAPSAFVAPKPSLSFSQATEILQAVRNGERSEEITAALADITRSANPWVSPEGFVGELWGGVGYQREIVPLLNHGELSHWKIAGWRWKVSPKVASYAGDKTDVPSNAPTTETVSVEASRLAGAHDIDRKFIDFNDVAFLDSYFRAMAESYAFESDKACAQFIVSSATAVVAPAGSNLLKQVAHGANAIRANARTRATFVLVNPTDMISLLDISASEVPAFLATLGISPENFIASEFVTAGTVIVGAKPAATFYELSGSPIRVEAVSIANGGHDAGVFGYTAALLHKPGGIVKVTVAPTP